MFFSKYAAEAGYIMSFQDMIKKNVLEGFSAENLLTSTIVSTMLVAILMGLYIYLIYRITAKSGFYSRGFNKSLAVLPVITSGILLAMQGSLVISLGMVGALSIVRFRNAVKETTDLTFLFWSISVGIIVGAGLYSLAVILSLGITVLMVGLDLLPKLRSPYLLVISGQSTLDERGLLAAIKTYCAQSTVRSRSITLRGGEWILELQTRNGDALVKRVAEFPGVTAVNLLSHDGEVRF